MGDLLKTLAPTLASALLGPLGGVAVAAIGKIIGVDSATVNTVKKAFEDGKLTPEHLAQIKELELQYQNEEKERGFRYADLEFKDRDSARQMQISTHSSTPTVLTYMVTAGFFGILGWMMHDNNVVDSPPIMIMLGSLGTAWTGCISFWFGTTQGSQNKDKLLANSIPTK
tara:strand:- start:1279 stop:1788 length:510 start_codon:yes stop_codon:yes gene_type:complete